MAIARDQAHPWRAASLSRIPVTYIDISSCMIDDEPSVTDPSGSLDYADWSDSVRSSSVDRHTASAAYNTGELQASYEVKDVRKEADASGCLTARVPLPYDYHTKATACIVTSDGDHMSVLADLNASTSSVLRTACSVEEVAKAAGIKLPRLTAGPGAVRASPLASSAAGVSDFEVLRGKILRCVANTDYGLRLYQLARIVAHATVCAESDRAAVETPAMRNALARSVLVSQTPLLTPNEYEANSFWYIGAEASASYRAFLYMGAVGVQHFSEPHTVYSQAIVASEVAQPERANVVFVRVGSLQGQVSPQPDDFLSVLRSPDQCLAYYMAYANSIGVGAKAALVLQQAAVLPHITGAEARLPYKPDYPSLDAAPYLFSPAKIRRAAAPVNVYEMVGSACVRATQVLVGLGARISCFENASSVDHGGVLSQVMQALADHKTCRQYAREVLDCVGAGESGIEWVSPFFPSLRAGTVAALQAFSEHAWIMATFRTRVCEGLRGVFDTGVPMQTALFSGSRNKSRRREAMLMQLAAQLPVTAFSAALTQSTVPHAVAVNLGYMRAWVAKCSFVVFSTRQRRSPRSSASSVGSIRQSTGLQFLARDEQAIGPDDSASQVAPAFESVKRVVSPTPRRSPRLAKAVPRVESQRSRKRLSLLSQPRKPSLPETIDPAPDPVSGSDASDISSSADDSGVEAEATTVIAAVAGEML